MFSHIKDIFREDGYVRGVCTEISNISLHLPLGIILSYAIIFVHGGYSHPTANRNRNIYPFHNK